MPRDLARHQHRRQEGADGAPDSGSRRRQQVIGLGADLFVVIYRVIRSYVAGCSEEERGIADEESNSDQEPPQIGLGFCIS